MADGEMLVVSGEQVERSLEGREQEVLEAVEAAYLAHAAGKTVLPHSVFLRIPGNGNERIIALPAYMAGRRNVAGLKWIASFPGNVQGGRERASAVLILNSVESGAPKAILEGSIISAKRTAASAALAAQRLGRGKTIQAALIGCGRINYEICRFLAITCPEIERLVLFDKDREKSRRTADAYGEVCGVDDVRVASNIDEALNDSDVVSFATTASRPYLDRLPTARPGLTILHISLRDLAVEIVLGADNVVDDIDHVCRAETSLHLAEQQVGNRDFIRCCLADVLSGKALPRQQPELPVIFSPFGLGILDLAVGDLVLSAVERDGGCIRIPSFLPEPWENRLRERSSGFKSSPASLV